MQSFQFRSLEVGDRIYNLYGIKTIMYMESPHKTWKTMEHGNVCVCVCISLNLCSTQGELLSMLGWGPQQCFIFLFTLHQSSVFFYLTLGGLLIKI